MRDFHLLGFIDGVTEANFLELKKLAYCGFLINGISGLMLFSSQASYLSTNLPFLMKLFFIISGMFLASQIFRKIEKKSDRTAVKILAILSLLSWFGAITAGRLIAYIF